MEMRPLMDLHTHTLASGHAYSTLKENLVDGIRLYNGIEANIFDEHGSIDVEEPILSKMDYIIASLHTPCIANLGIVRNTAALVGAA